MSGSQGQGKASKAEESRYQDTTRVVRLEADGVPESGSSRDKAI